MEVSDKLDSSLFLPLGLLGLLLEDVSCNLIYQRVKVDIGHLGRNYLASWRRRSISFRSDLFLQLLQLLWLKDSRHRLGVLVRLPSTLRRHQPGLLLLSPVVRVVATASSGPPTIPILVSICTLLSSPMAKVAIGIIFDLIILQ